MNYVSQVTLSGVSGTGLRTRTHSAGEGLSGLGDRDEFLTNGRGGRGVDRPVQGPASASLSAVGTELGGEIVHRFLHPLEFFGGLMTQVCTFFHKDANDRPVI
jgi:hypothetical protein